MFDAKGFSSAVLAARGQKRLSIKELADRIGLDLISEATLKRVEHGLRVNPKYVMLIARELEINLYDFITCDTLVEFFDSFEYVPEDDSVNPKRAQMQRLELVERFLLCCTPNKMPIVSLYTFLLYAPLVPPLEMAEFLQRMDGDFYPGREAYLAHQLMHLRSSIKIDDAALYVVFKTASHLTYNYMGYECSPYSIEPEELERLHNAYRKKLDDNLEAARNISQRGTKH